MLSIERMRVVIVLASLVAAVTTFARPADPKSLSGAPQTPDSPAVSKAPWEWTLDERLAERLDGKRIRERMEAHRRDREAPASAIATEAAVGDDVRFVVEGSKNPELFLPYELLNALLHGVSSHRAFAQRSRESYSSRIHDFGWEDAGFWLRLEKLSANYQRLMERASVIDAEIATAGTAEERRRLQAMKDGLPTEVCRERAAILTAARATFGTAEFDRFLYTVVGPSLFVFSKLPPADEGEKLRRLEQGCR